MPRATDEDFDAFVAGQSTRLLRTAYLLVGDRDVAEALAHRATQASRRDLKNIGSFTLNEFVLSRIASLYLSPVARFTSLLKIRSFREPMRTAPGHTPANSTDPIVVAFRSLPRKQRTIATFRYYVRLTPQQIGRLLGQTTSRTNSHLAQSLSTMTATLRASASSTETPTSSPPSMTRQIACSLEMHASAISPNSSLPANSFSSARALQTRVTLVAIAVILATVGIVSIRTADTPGKPDSAPLGNINEGPSTEPPTIPYVASTGTALGADTVHAYGSTWEPGSPIGAPLVPVSDSGFVGIAGTKDMGTQALILHRSGQRDLTLESLGRSAEITGVSASKNGTLVAWSTTQEGKTTFHVAPTSGDHRPTTSASPRLPSSRVVGFVDDDTSVLVAVQASGNPASELPYKWSIQNGSFQPVARDRSLGESFIIDSSQTAKSIAFGTLTVNGTLCWSAYTIDDATPTWHECEMNGSSSSLSFSPNGTLVAISTSRSGKTGIRVLNSSDGRVIAAREFDLGITSSVAEKPAWEADDSLLLQYPIDTKTSVLRCTVDLSRCSTIQAPRGLSISVLAGTYS